MFLETCVQGASSLAYIRQITCVTCQLVDSPFTVGRVCGGFWAVLIRLAMVLRHLCVCVCVCGCVGVGVWGGGCGKLFPITHYIPVQLVLFGCSTMKTKAL